ncbi:hypothetical protein MMC17_009985 [Xylographa soralifera]|nr:hypothetical protein [Xylographa soralifera]
MDGQYQCNRNRHNLRIPDGTHSRKYTEINFQVRQREVMLTDGSMWGKPWQFEKIGTGDTRNTRQSALYNGEYVGTIEVVVLRCYPVVLEKPLAHVEETESMQTVPWPESKLRTEKSRAPKMLGNRNKSDEGPAEPFDIVNRAQVDGVGKMDPGRIAQRLYGYDGQWDEPDTRDLHTADHWGFEMTGSNTGVYRPAQKGRPTQAQQGKRQKGNKGSKTKNSQENRSQVNEFNNEGHGSANQAIQATPTAVVINITQAPPQVKDQKRQAGRLVSRSEDSRSPSHTACHSVDIENKVSSSDSSELRRRGVSDAKGGDLWGHRQHGDPTSQNSSLKGKPQSWKDAYSEKKHSNTTANWVDSINEELKHDACSDGHSKRNGAEVMSCTELNGKEYWTERKRRHATKTAAVKLPRSKDNHHQSSRSNMDGGRKRGKGWSKSIQPFDSEGEWATQQQQQQDFQSSVKCGSDSVSWQLPEEKIASGGFDTYRNVIADTQSTGKQDATEPPRLVPGGWPRASPDLPTHYRRNIGNEDHRSTNQILQQTENVPISIIRDSATLIPPSVQQHWGPSHLASHLEPVSIGGALVPAPAGIERASGLPNINGSRFHSDRSHPRSKESTPRLWPSSAERPGLDSRSGRSSIYSIPEAVIWPRNVSHQVQSGQPVAYSHKMATPKYMDSHESPYAVFVFQYRSRPVIEQLLKVTMEESEEQEKERLKDLTKAKIIEHYMRKKSSQIQSQETMSGGLAAVQEAASRNATLEPRVESHGGLGVDMGTVSDRLSRFQMQNTTESVRASPTADEWGNEQEKTISEKRDALVGREPSWGNWAGEGKKNSGLNTDEQEHENAAHNSEPAEECEMRRHLNVSNIETSRGRPGYSWTWRTGELEGTDANADAAMGAGKKQGQSRWSESRLSKSKSRATASQSANNWKHASHRGSVEKVAIPWEGEAEQNECRDVRSPRHQKQNSPVVVQVRRHWPSQENTADNVEW